MLLGVFTYFRYECGAARRLVSEGTGEHIRWWNISCQWNKTWSSPPELPVCDWVLFHWNIFNIHPPTQYQQVACLKPTIPPIGSNLVVANWDGQPIPFGNEVNTRRTSTISTSCIYNSFEPMAILTQTNPCLHL